MAREKVYGFYKNKSMAEVIPEPTHRSTVLPAGNWSDVSGVPWKYSQVVNLPGVDGDETKQNIFWSPAAASVTAAYECGVACVSQGTDTLTFVCNKKPNASINIMISIFEVG